MRVSNTILLPEPKNFCSYSCFIFQRFERVQAGAAHEPRHPDLAQVRAVERRLVALAAANPEHHGISSIAALMNAVACGATMAPP